MAAAMEEDGIRYSIQKLRLNCSRVAAAMERMELDTASKHFG
jgi:hypothetical protein